MQNTEFSSIFIHPVYFHLDEVWTFYMNDFCGRILYHTLSFLL
jgi:hypothetical protein